QFPESCGIVHDARFFDASGRERILPAASSRELHHRLPALGSQPFRIPPCKHFASCGGRGRSLLSRASRDARLGCRRYDEPPVRAPSRPDRTGRVDFGAQRHTPRLVDPPDGLLLHPLRGELCPPEKVFGIERSLFHDSALYERGGGVLHTSFAVVRSLPGERVLAGIDQSRLPFAIFPTRHCPDSVPVRPPEHFWRVYRCGTALRNHPAAPAAPGDAAHNRRTLPSSPFPHRFERRPSARVAFLVPAALE